MHRLPVNAARLLCRWPSARSPASTTWACMAARGPGAGDVRDDERALGPAPRRSKPRGATTHWREHGLTPTQLALAFCYVNWRGEHHHRRHLHGAARREPAAWGTTLSPELLADRRDPLELSATRRNRGGTQSHSTHSPCGWLREDAFATFGPDVRRRRARPWRRTPCAAQARQGSLRGALRAAATVRCSSRVAPGRYCHTTDYRQHRGRAGMARRVRARPTPRHRRRRRGQITLRQSAIAPCSRATRHWSGQTYAAQAQHRGQVAQSDGPQVVARAARPRRCVRAGLVAGRASRRRDAHRAGRIAPGLRAQRVVKRSHDRLSPALAPISRRPAAGAWFRRYAQPPISTALEHHLVGLRRAGEGGAQLSGFVDEQLAQARRQHLHRRRGLRAGAAAEFRCRPRAPAHVAAGRGEPATQIPCPGGPSAPRGSSVRSGPPASQSSASHSSSRAVKGEPSLSHQPPARGRS